MGLSSLEEVYKMSWREFQLRLYAHQRQEAERHKIARQIAYYSGYAFNVKKPKPIEQFWQVKTDKQAISEDIRKKMQKAITAARVKVGK